MKDKRLLYSPLIAMLIISVLSVIPFIGSAYTPASPGTWLHVVPDPSYHSSAWDVSLVGTRFNVTVNIFNVTNFGAWEWKLWYNTTLLDAIRVYKTTLSDNNTDWVPSDVPGTFNPTYGINDTMGRVFYSAVIPLSTPWTNSPSGTDPILTIEFEITLSPPVDWAPPATRSVSCPLSINETVLGYNTGPPNYNTGPIAHSIDDGFYEYERDQRVAGAPTAEFLYPAFTTVCTDVELTDISNPVSGSINTRVWTIVAGPATWVSADNMSTRTFHCDGPGTVTINLWVNNTAGLADDVSHDIQQIEITGPAIDLYDKHERQYPEGTWTPYIGEGPHADGDSYAPGENVTLYADVTYNEDIVQNILVGFEVLDPLGRCVTYRVARTNETGTATVWFRIPIPCDPEEQELLFGHWWAIAKCKVQDEIINDTKSFKVGWIVEIISVETTPYTSWYKTEFIVMNVTLKNIAWIPRMVTLIVVVYDDCDVPIGQVVVEFEIPGATPVLCSEYVMSVFFELHIPKWAYVGPGKVYANAFTHLPQDCGIPYCPEVETDITIELGTRP